METSEDERRVDSGNNNADQLDEQGSGVLGDWGYRVLSMGMVPTSSVMPGSSIPVTSAPCSVVDGGTPGLWFNSTSSPAFGFSTNGISGTTTAPNFISDGKSLAMPSRGMFLAPPMPGVIPAGLPHFPTDSSFIERAARFSCFGGGGSFGDLVSPFGLSGPMAAYASVTKDMLGAQLQGTDSNIAEAKDHFRPIEHGLKSLNDGGGFHVGASNYDPHEATLGESSQEAVPRVVDPAGGSSPDELDSKKRKRTNEDIELERIKEARPSVETPKEKTENKHKVDQSDSKANGKQVKEGSEGAKEDYIHIRARRGQATNSHSLAERVRREKISERMKYLQDLVPGCSKVTGKAVMLDEIINYVQSLQRQVEFLSMKLAAVNPRLDFNVEGLLAGDVLHSQAGPSAAVGFTPDMIHPQLHISQHGMAQPGISVMANYSDVFRRTMNAQPNTMSSFKEPVLQMHGSWDEDLQNAMHASYGANPPVSSPELNNKARDRFQVYDQQWQDS